MLSPPLPPNDPNVVLVWMSHPMNQRKWVPLMRTPSTRPSWWRATIFNFEQIMSKCNRSKDVPGGGDDVEKAKEIEEKRERHHMSAKWRSAEWVRTTNVSLQSEGGVIADRPSAPAVSNVPPVSCLFLPDERVCVCVLVWWVRCMLAGVVSFRILSPSHPPDACSFSPTSPPSPSLARGRAPFAAHSSSSTR